MERVGTMTPRFRRLFKVATPGWLRNPEFDGERVLFSLGKLCDAFAEKALRGLEARFPSRAPASANKLTGGDRGILLGRSELNADYATRLREWRLPRTHRVRGNAYEALLQIWHYWGGIYAATIDSHGLRHVIQATDTPDVDTLADPDTVTAWVDAGETQWDGVDADTHWSRFWIVLQPTEAMGIGAQPDLDDPDLWGGSLPATGYTLGQTGVTIDDVTAMRALFQDLNWNPGNTRPEWLLLSLTESVTPEPNPDWKYWSVDDGGTRVAARSEDWRFWSLDPLYNNTYAGLRDRPWPAAATNVDESGTYDGDRTSGAAFGPVMLPSGTRQTTGTRTRFPERVLLVDDGSFPQ